MNPRYHSRNSIEISELWYEKILIARSFAGNDSKYSTTRYSEEINQKRQLSSPPVRSEDYLNWPLIIKLAIIFLISSSFLILSSVVQGDRASSMSPSFLVVEHSRDIRQREKPREKIEENVIKIVKSWENHFCTLLNTCRERWTRYFRCENKKMGNSSL